MLFGMDNFSRKFQRRSSVVLIIVGLLSSIGVYLGHSWFHHGLLPALGLNEALGDAIGGFMIILSAYVCQRLVSLTLYQDTELGSIVAIQDLHQTNQEMKIELGELDRLASTDKLTGAWNRRRLEETLTSEMGRLERYESALCVLVADIDLFKSINDRFGHNTGDRVLIEIAVHLRGALRSTDSLTRWGGEEFVVLCPNTTLSTARLLAERLRENIAKVNFPEAGKVTISVGLAECQQGESWDEWFKRADEALYRAKHEGRNRVCFSPNLPVPGEVGEKMAGNFVRLVWRGAYESGHEVIDLQHKALFSDANELLAAILSGKPADEVGSMADNLMRTVIAHFSDEEGFVAATDFQKMAEHSAEHRKLAKQAEFLVQTFHEGKLEVGELFRFLTYDLIAKHILGADREFFPYLHR